MKSLLMAAIMLLPLAARGQASGFQPLMMHPGKDTSAAQYQLRLAEPDNPEKPAMWQGPLTISRGSASCNADVSLVTAIYAAPGRDYVVVLSSSGSHAVAHFVELASCGEKWPSIKRAASTVKVAGNRLSFFPACEGDAKNTPALCTSARVYTMQAEAPPLYRRVLSYKLTEKELGVGFIGEAKIMDPRTARAIIVH